MLNLTPQNIRFDFEEDIYTFNETKKEWVNAGEKSFLKGASLDETIKVILNRLRNAEPDQKELQNHKSFLDAVKKYSTKKFKWYDFLTFGLTQKLRNEKIDQKITAILFSINKKLVEQQPLLSHPAQQQARPHSTLRPPPYQPKPPATGTQAQQKILQPLQRRTSAPPWMPFWMKDVQNENQKTFFRAYFDPGQDKDKLLKSQTPEFLQGIIPTLTPHLPKENTKLGDFEVDLETTQDQLEAQNLKNAIEAELKSKEENNPPAKK